VAAPFEVDRHAPPDDPAIEARVTAIARQVVREELSTSETGPRRAAGARQRVDSEG